MEKLRKITLCFMVIMAIAAITTIVLAAYIFINYPQCQFTTDRNFVHLSTANSTLYYFSIGSVVVTAVSAIIGFSMLSVYSKKVAEKNRRRR